MEESLEQLQGRTAIAMIQGFAIALKERRRKKHTEQNKKHIVRVDTVVVVVVVVVALLHDQANDAHMR